MKELCVVFVVYLLSFVSSIIVYVCDVIIMSCIFRPSVHVHCSVAPHVLSVNVSLLSVNINLIESTLN